MLSGKKKYKCRFEVKVEKIEGLPEKIKGQPFRVEYARGKDQSGISRTLTMTSKNMAVNYSFKLECNLMFEEKKGVRKFSEKSLTFQVVAEKSKEVKKDTNIGKAEFDLTVVAVPGEYEPKQRIECHGKDKSDVKCVLVVSFKTEVIKIDGKKLVKADPSKPKSSKSAKPVDTDADPYGDLPDFGTDPAASGGRTIEVGGQEYDLQTDNELSEAGVESDNDAKTENDYLSDSDEGKDDPFEQDAEPTEEEKKLASKMEEDEKRAADEAKKAEDAKKAADEAKKAADEAKKAEEAAKKSGDEKKAKEEEKKRKEEEEKRKKEEEKKRKEEEKRLKEEEDKRKKEEEKKRKEDEKRAKEEEERRKKQEKADRAAGVTPPPAAVASPTPTSSKDSKDAKKDASKATSSSAPTSDSVSVASTAAAPALEAKIKQLTEEKAALQSEKDKAMADLEAEKKNVLSLKKDLKSAESALEDVQAKLKREEAKNSGLEGDMKRLEAKLSLGGAAAGAAAASSIDAAEITRLESQLRKLRQDNQELQDNLDDTTKKLRQQEELVEMHDAGHALKQIEGLELENAKLRQVLDDHNLLKGNLIQELKHRQSERHIRIEKHQKDVESGSAPADEITSYKPRHSRQNSTDSSNAKSPRSNGASSTASTSSATSKKDTKDTKEPAVAAEPKKPKKTISMDDDSSPVPSRTGSKRAPVSAVPTILEEVDQFAAADSSEKMKNLESRLSHDEKIESCLYNAVSQYDEAGLSLPADKLANYILKQKALDKSDQHTEASHALLVHVLQALYGQAQRHAGDVDVLVGILQWSTSLLQILQKETSTIEDAPPASHMTWAVDVEACGVILKFDALIDATEEMGDGKFKVERTFDDIAADATPGEAFLQLLDQMTSYVYVLIFTYMQSLTDEQKLTELFFGQTSQLAAALNGSNPLTRNQPGAKKITAPKPMNTFTQPLDVFLNASRRHLLNKTVESQLLAQFFYWCSSTIVNALVQQTEHCSAAVGMSLKVAVSHVEQWISQNTSRRLSSWVEDQFAATREAANVLTIDKQIFQSIDALEGIFTTLNIAQIHKLLTQFQTDDFCPDPVPRTTLDVLRNTINKTNTKVTFLDGTVLLSVNGE